MAKVLLLDTETTGLHEKYNGVVQIAGIVKINGKEAERFNIKCRPFPSDNVEQEALAVTGNTLEEIMSWQDPKDAYKELLSILGKYVNKYAKTDKFFFCGYNAEFDMRMMRGWFNKHGDKYFGSWFWFPPICAMQLSAVHAQEVRHLLPNFKLETVCKHFGVEFNKEEAHDAFYDIAKTEQLMELLMNGGRKTSAANFTKSPAQ